jgi:hypothetical protein
MQKQAKKLLTFLLHFCAFVQEICAPFFSLHKKNYWVTVMSGKNYPFVPQR